MPTGLVAMIDEVRAVLAGHDLAAVTTEFDADAVEPALEAAEPERVVAPPLVGARFAGAGERTPRSPRRSRFRSP